ncbi:MAG: amidohydrolase family protein, partial [Clostridia bacterium]|nr:amidohydrolase family protein [Clostridia bacterium]
ADGTVDMIATDHAPHSAEEKSKGLRGSLMGVVGLETAFPVLYTELVLKGRIPLSRVIDAMTEAPLRRFGLSGGRIGVGMPADLFAVDLEKSYRIDPSRFLSMGRATPFEGMHVFGEIQMTLVGGKTVYAAEKLRND